LTEERKAIMIQENSQKFGNISIGIHGKELPKYSDSTPDREFWKHYNGYTNSPIH
jgi:hypothetical protein